MDTVQITVAILIFGAVSGIVYVALSPFMADSTIPKKRLQAIISAEKTSRITQKRAGEAIEKGRRAQIAASLREMEARQKTAQGKWTLQQAIDQSGLDISKNQFYIISLISGLAFTLFLYFTVSQYWIVLLGIFIGTLGVPRWVLSFFRKRRLKKFTEDLPVAIDMIARGVRVGLPVRECFRSIATDLKGPIQEEFQGVMESMSVGMSMKDAMLKLPQNIPTAEASFIAVVIALQQDTGGSISGAFNNLANLIRDRKKLRSKVAVYSMEAKASASIIAALPIVVVAAVAAMQPAFLEPLFYTTKGHYVLAGSGLWMLTGILIMAKMINFKI